MEKLTISEKNKVLQSQRFKLLNHHDLADSYRESYEGIEQHSIKKPKRLSSVFKSSALAGIQTPNLPDRSRDALFIPIAIGRATGVLSNIQ